MNLEKISNSLLQTKNTTIPDTYRKLSKICNPQLTVAGRRWEYFDTPETLGSRIVETATFQPGSDQACFHNVYGQDLAVLENFARGGVSQMNTSDAYGTMKFCFAAELSELDGKAVFNNDPRL